MISSRIGLFLGTLALVASCDSPRSVRDAGPRPVEGLLVTVNGHPLTRSDLQVSMRSAPTHGGATENEHDALERIIQEELQAQRALEMNLDDDANFREQDRLAEARFHAARRSQLATLYEQHQTGQRATVSDAEARAYYEANGPRIRTEVRVQQILMRDETAAQQAAHDIHGGAPFEEVARRQFPDIAPALHPWDLGVLRWNQIPEAWRTTLDAMTVGQTSDVISGPNHRHWVIKLLERRESPEVTFEVARPAIIQVLTEQHTVALRTNEAAELRRRARVVYTQHVVQ